MADSGKIYDALTVVNTIWLAGITLHQWKQTGAIKAQLEEHSKAIRDLQGKTSNIPNIVEALKELDESVLSLEEKVAAYPMPEDMNTMVEQVEQLISDLRDSNINVTRISDKSKKKCGRKVIEEKPKVNKRPPVAEESDFDAAAIVAAVEGRPAGRSRSRRPRERF